MALFFKKLQISCHTFALLIVIYNRSNSLKNFWSFSNFYVTFWRSRQIYSRETGKRIHFHSCTHNFIKRLADHMERLETQKRPRLLLHFGATAVAYFYRTVFFSCSFFLSIFKIVSTVCLAIKYSCISFLT